MYNKKIMELFLNPNHSGLLHGANASSTTTETISGDMLKMYLRVGEENEKILDASFKALGSPALIAVTSVLMDIVIGKTLDEALLIKGKEILNILGDLPENKLYCIDFAFDTLQTTINDYYDKLRKEEKRLNKLNKTNEAKDKKNLFDGEIGEPDKSSMIENEENFEDIEEDLEEEIIEENSIEEENLSEADNSIEENIDQENNVHKNNQELLDADLFED